MVRWSIKPLIGTRSWKSEAKNRWNGRCDDVNDDESLTSESLIYVWRTGKSVFFFQPCVQEYALWVQSWVEIVANIWDSCTGGQAWRAPSRDQLKQWVHLCWVLSTSSLGPLNQYSPQWQQVLASTFTLPTETIQLTLLLKPITRLEINAWQSLKFTVNFFCWLTAFFDDR